jgi:hypothetical protein
VTRDLDALHAALVERIDTTPAIRGAFDAHPRHRFIPDMVWPDATGLPLYRTADPERWARLVYSTDAVTTQANDGGSGPERTQFVVVGPSDDGGHDRRGRDRRGHARAGDRHRHRMERRHSL